MATAAPEAAHTAHGVRRGPAGARCLGTVSVEPLPPSPWWRRSLRVFARHQQNIFCGTAFHPHDQIGVRGQRVVQSVAERRQHHHVHLAKLGQGWVGTDLSAARIRSHHHRTESPPGPRPPGTRRRAAPYRWRPGVPAGDASTMKPPSNPRRFRVCGPRPGRTDEGEPGCEDRRDVLVRHNPNRRVLARWRCPTPRSWAACCARGPDG